MMNNLGVPQQKPRAPHALLQSPAVGTGEAARCKSQTQHRAGRERQFNLIAFNLRSAATMHKPYFIRIEKKN